MSDQTQLLAASDGLWLHSSGISLPRGTVVSSVLDADELAGLEKRSDRRGAREGAQRARRVSRPIADARHLHELCAWLATHGLDILGTVTYSDEYARTHGIYSLPSALRDVRRGLAEVRMKRGTIQGFRGRFVLAGEWHPSGRQVPHVHLCLDSMGAPIEAVCSDLFRYFKQTRGRSRFEPMRDVTEATLYGLKDTVKAAAHDASCLDMRLVRPRCSKGRR